MLTLQYSSFGSLSRLAAVLAIAVPLAGCETVSSAVSSVNPFGAAKATSDLAKDEPAEVLFNDGLARLQNKNYEAAIKKFAEVDKQYPYTSWSKRSLLLTTFASYEARGYEEAISSGRRYVQLYPSEKDAAYAQYLIGMSYFNQMPDVTRDQERSQRALLAMDELIRKWPDSEYVPDARQRVAVARDQLAGKEMDVGRFYLNQRNYTGAVNRFREVLTKYQTTPRPTWRLVLCRKHRQLPLFSAITSRTAPGTRMPSGSCRAAVSSLGRTSHPGSAGRSVGSAAASVCNLAVLPDFSL
jgi:outer membrane protein assembly factor BamD